MLQVHKTITVPADQILRVSVPDVPKGEEVEVYIYTKNGSPSYEDKLALLDRAVNDPLYLKDMEEAEDILDLEQAIIEEQRIPGFSHEEAKKKLGL
jgi:hypothetical protein